MSSRAELQPAPSSRLARVAVALLCALSFVLALSSGHGAYWYNADEAIYWSLAGSSSLAEMMFALDSQAHPPGLFLLTRLAFAFDSGINWLRLPSLLVGVCLPALVFWFGRLQGGVVVGLVAALITACSTALIEQSLLIRPYLFQVAALLIGLIGLVEACDRPGKRALAFYLLGMGSALLLVYSSVFVLAGAGVVILAQWGRGSLRGRALWTLLAAQVPLAGLVVWLVVSRMGPGMIRNVLERGEPPFWLKGQYADGVLGGLANAGSAIAAVVGYTASPLPAALLLLVGMGFAWRRGRWDLALLVGVVVSIGSVLAAAKLHPFGGTRHSLFLFPSAVILLAWPVAASLTARGWLPRAIGVLLLGGLIHTQVQSLGVLQAGLRRPGTRERVVLRSVADSTRAELTRLAEAGALCVTDNTTLWLLEPLLEFRHSDVEPISTVAGPLLRVRWNGLTIVLSPQGRPHLVAGRKRLGQGAHLETILRRAENHPELAVPLEGGHACLIQGGWGRSIPETLAPETASGRTVWDRLIGGRGLQVGRLHVDAYRELLGLEP